MQRIAVQLVLLGIFFPLGLAQVTLGALTAVSGASLDFEPTPSGTYAVAPHTVVAGEALAEGGGANTLASCLDSCNQRANCSAVNFCGEEGGCELPASPGDTAPRGYCQLLVPATVWGIAVRELGSGNPRFGTAAVRMLIDFPGTADGYYSLYGRGFPTARSLQCPNETVQYQGCVRRMELQEALDLCNSSDSFDYPCQAISYTPIGSSNVTGPLARFLGDPAGEPLTMANTTFCPACTAYVKRRELSASPAPEGGSGPPPDDQGDGGGLSGGAIAGIVVGSACAVAALLGAGLWWRRRRQMCSATAGRASSSENGKLADPEAPNTSNASMGLGAQMQSANPSESTHPSNSSKLMDQLADTGALQWDDVLVPPEAVELCHGDAAGNLAKLGGGASGNVYRAVLHGNTPCACKIVEFDARNTAKHFVQEVRMMWKINHPHIVQFLGASVNDDQGMLLMELMEGGDLEHALNTPAADGSRERELAWGRGGWRIALQIAVGLDYLHKARIAHLDLKSRNVMLTKDRAVAKIGDVGFSKIMRHEFLSSLGSRMGTFDWAAPEVLLGQSATEKADIYSFGVLLWEIVTGELPLRGRCRKLETPQDCPPDIVELHARCTTADPALRPTAAEVVALLQSACKAAGLSGGGGSGGGSEGSAAGERSAAHAPLGMLRSVRVHTGAAMQSPLAAASIQAGTPLALGSQAGEQGALDSAIGEGESDW